MLLDRVVNLLEEGIDVGIRIGTLEDSSLVAQPLGQLRRMVVASPAFLRRHGTPQHPKDLRQANCVRFMAGGSTGWTFHENGKALQVPVSGNLDFNHVAPAVEACVAGLGFGRFISYQVAPFLAQDLVRVLPELVGRCGAHVAVLPQQEAAARAHAGVCGLCGGAVQRAGFCAAWQARAAAGMLASFPTSTYKPPMPTFDFDFFVIGGGSGGVRAARMAGQRGLRVAMAESGALGGTCVNVGCIPKKLYSYAAHFAEAFEESHGFGWQGEAPTLDWPQLKAHRAKEITRLNGIYQQLLTGAGVHLLTGHAQLVDAHTVQVNGTRFTAQHILVATGGTPSVPPVPGGDLVVTSNAMFDLDPFPQRLVVVGGGYIACEFASIFNGLGAQVTLLAPGPNRC